MPAGLRSRIVNGNPDLEYTGAAFATKFFEAGARRARRLMCDGCKHGSHSICESEECPCVCNDSDFRWSRKSDAQKSKTAQVLAVRPELEPLFR